uniref:CCHC-type domain-containing protein n=1 Tax=Physcomitrium patens TaxID=3218 RepID=A0A2K1IFC8_PHYPA|nr:hypothetical protein PHYPA_028574 [Physcomitrium patens]
MAMAPTGAKTSNYQSSTFSKRETIWNGRSTSSFSPSTKTINFEVENVDLEEHKVMEDYLENVHVDHMDFFLRPSTIQQGVGQIRAVRPQRQCYNCKDIGHSAMSCPKHYQGNNHSATIVQIRSMVTGQDIHQLRLDLLRFRIRSLVHG